MSRYMNFDAYAEATVRHIEDLRETAEYFAKQQKNWTPELRSAAQELADQRRENAESTRISLLDAARFYWFKKNRESEN